MWSRDRRHTGRTDLPLTAYGESQARALAAPLRAVRPALVLTSPLLRARRTSELAELSARTEPDLVEWDYGDYEGLTTEEIRERVPGWTVWTAPCPGGESADQVSERLDRVVRRVRAALAEGPVVCVSHGHALRALGARWLGLPVTGGSMLTLDAAARCVLGSEHGRPAVHRWNLPNPADPEAVP